MGVCCMQKMRWRGQATPFVGVRKGDTNLGGQVKKMKQECLNACKGGTMQESGRSTKKSDRVMALVLAFARWLELYVGVVLKAEEPMKKKIGFIMKWQRNGT